MMQCGACQSSEPESGTLLSKGPCEGCGSSDACVSYADGHTHCYSCGKHSHGGKSVSSPRARSTPAGMLAVTSRALSKRKLHLSTCQQWGYGVARNRGQEVQVAQWFDPDTHEVRAQKVRAAGKKFHIKGDSSYLNTHFYGQWLFPAGCSRYLTVVEGELDALSVHQAGGRKYPVVSLPSGVKSAERVIKAQLAWLESFESVVWMLDNDAPGNEAAKVCAGLLAPGKSKIAKLPLKDASEMLQAERGDEIARAFWAAELFRPGGLLTASELFERMLAAKNTRPIARYPFPKMDEMTQGIRPGEIHLICSGSGMGKTELTRQIACSFADQGLKIGYISLEEHCTQTGFSIAGLYMGRQLKFEENPQEAEGLREVWAKNVEGRFFFFDHFGSLESDELMAKIRFLRVGYGCDVVVLDHLSIVVSGMEGPDERKNIDVLMTRLKSYCQSAELAMLLISHLKGPDKGKPLEEGGQTSLSLLRGSRSIGQLANAAYGLERDQQDEKRKHLSILRSLKDRWTGRTGLADTLVYNESTGKMSPVSEDFPEDEEF